MCGCQLSNGYHAALWPAAAHGGDDSWEMDEDLLPDSSGSAAAAKAPAAAAGLPAAGSSADGSHGLPKSRLQNTTTARDSGPTGEQQPRLRAACIIHLYDARCLMGNAWL